MSRHDERERIRQHLTGLASRVEATKTASLGSAMPRQAGAGKARRVSLSATDIARAPVSDVPSASLRDDAPEDLLPYDNGFAGEPETIGARTAAPTTRLESGGAVREPSWLDEQPIGSSWWRDRLVPERFRHMRMNPGTRGVVALAVVGFAAALVAAGVAMWERPTTHPVPPLPMAHTADTSSFQQAPVTGPDGPPAGNPGAASPSSDAPAELVVSVVGVVQRPGLVRVPPGSRVADALAAAGGTRAGADLTGLNLAQRLADGNQVSVGSVPAGEPTPRVGSTTISGAGPSVSGAGEGSAEGTAATVDLNTATEAELEALPGVGPVTARAIIGWRESNGRFTDIEQLTDVEGIGPVRLGRLRDAVTV